MNIAQYIDHAALHPTQTKEDILKELEIAKAYNTASICVKPYSVKLATDFLKGSEVKVCTVIGFPHGSNIIETKVAEAAQAIKEGATEIDMVINIGKALECDWAYIETEISSILSECKKSQALLKVIVETDYVNKTESLIKLCEICSKVGVDYIKTSTGFGFHKNDEGILICNGAQLEHIKLFKKHLSNGVKIKASGGIKNISQAKAFIEAGAERLGTSGTAAIVKGEENTGGY